jgi:hypothetical protein
MASFDDVQDARSYAEPFGAWVTEVAHNPSPPHALYRVQLTCGKLSEPSNSIKIEVGLSNTSDRRHHGQMYAGNPGIWIIYVEAENQDAAKAAAVEVVTNALTRLLL